MNYSRVIIFFFFVLFSRVSFGQNYGDKEFYLIDSLNLNELPSSDSALIHGALKKYHGASEEIDKVKALGIITEGMMHDDWERYNNYVLKIVEKNLAQNLPPDLEKRYLHSLATAVNNQGIIHNQNGLIPEALKCFLRSLKIQEKIGDKDGAATTINNIGTIYHLQNNTEKTLEYLEKSLAMRKEIGDKKGIAQSYNNLGSFYYRQTANAKALAYFKKALKVNEEISNKEGIAYSLANIGNIYDIDDVLLGLNYHKRSLEIRKEIGDKKGIAIDHYSVGHSLFLLNNQKEAMEYAIKSFELSSELGYPDYIQKAALLLSKIYEKNGNHKAGWGYYRTHISLRDSIININNKNLAIRQGEKYEHEKELAIKKAEYNKQLEIVAEREQKQKVINYSISGGFILALIFGFFFMNKHRITKKQKVIIEEQKNLVDEKNQEITDSITYAKRIQDALLPSADELNKKLKNGFIFYKPKDIVAGDFYWLESLDDTILYAVADCTGHGVPGAIISVVCNNALNRAVREYKLTSPGLILDKVKEIVIETFAQSDQEVKDGMDIALCAINFKTNKLRFAGANNPVYVIRHGTLIETKGDKQSIGRYSGGHPFTEHEIELEPEDTIYTFTDGYPDQFGGPKGKKLKYKPFKETLIKLSKETMNNQHAILNKAFKEWKGDLEQIDDVCVIGVKV